MVIKGFRFQTKLILAMACVILVVTVATLLVTEGKIRKAYTNQFKAEFSSLAAGIELSRETRSQGGMELAANLAKHPYVVNFLKQKSPP